MRIKVRHETRYTYDEPASDALQLLRMTPRPHEGQFIRRWRVAVTHLRSIWVSRSGGRACSSG